MHAMMNARGPPRSLALLRQIEQLEATFPESEQEARQVQADKERQELREALAAHRLVCPGGGALDLDAFTGLLSRLLAPKVPAQEHTAALFAEIDKQGFGTISARELNRSLRETQGWRRWRSMAGF